VARCAGNHLCQRRRFRPAVCGSAGCDALFLRHRTAFGRPDDGIAGHRDTQGARPLAARNRNRHGPLRRVGRGRLAHRWENSSGLLFVFAGAFVGALGSVYLKTIDLSPLRLVAWAGFFSTMLLFPLSLSLESGQITSSMAVPWQMAGALLFSGIVVSVFAHTVYFDILQRNEAGIVAPITLLTPIFTIIMGAGITGDEVGSVMLAGAALAAGGVLIIAVRPSPTFFKGLLVRPRI